MSALGDWREQPQASLGLLDHPPLSRAQCLRSRGITTHATTFPASSVYELLEAVEEVAPGLLDVYIELRLHERSQQGED